MKRRVDSWLSRWKDNRERDVLLLRGARQVGKTFPVRRLGESFEHYLEVNFEENEDIHSFFGGSRSPTPICEKLSAYFKLPIIPGRTLLFLDDFAKYKKRALGLDISSFLVASDVELVNKGSIAEVHAGLELIKNASPVIKPSLHYWHRESRGSSAELDYVIQHGNEILPVEVKSGSSGKMRSMHMFLEERGLTHGVRMSLENFSSYGKIETVLLYCASRFHA